MKKKYLILLAKNCFPKFVALGKLSMLPLRKYGVDDTLKTKFRTLSSKFPKLQFVKQNYDFIFILLFRRLHNLTTKISTIKSEIFSRKF